MRSKRLLNIVLTGDVSVSYRELARHVHPATGPALAEQLHETESHASMINQPNLSGKQAQAPIRQPSHP